MHNKKKILIGMTFTLLILSIPGLSQISYKLESNAIAGSGENTPFWLLSNQHGISSVDMPNGYLRVGIFNESKQTGNWKYRAGLDVVESHNFYSKFLLQQAYLDIIYRKFELSIGSKEYDSKHRNQQLTSGSMCWSGNARPIPMIRLSTPEAFSFPWLLHNNLKFKAAMAFGWFTDGDYQKTTVTAYPLDQSKNYTNNVLYHQKQLEIYYQRPNSPFSFNLDIQLEMQFCGQRYFRWGAKDTFFNTPATLKHYLMALIPSQGDKTSALGDQQYAFGNTLGSFQFNINYDQPNYGLKFYVENFFEDFSGMSKQNGLDGLWGLEYASKQKRGITGVVLEYLQTTDQSGPIHWAPGDYPTAKLRDQATGNDDYYNNYSFAGWEHWGMTNGNPLLSSPVYNKNGSLKIQNNRVKALHIGFTAGLSDELSCRVLSTYSDNWGRHYLPFTQIKNDYSMLLELSYVPRKLNGWVFTTSGALDQGDLYGNNRAFSMKISKRGLLSH